MTILQPPLSVRELVRRRKEARSLLCKGGGSRATAFGHVDGGVRGGRGGEEVVAVCGGLETFL